MTVKQIKASIDQNLDKAFEVLDECLDENPRYNDLVDQYIDRPENFNMSNFRSRLKALVGRPKNKKLLQAYFLDKRHVVVSPPAIDKTYQLFCKLNFTSQFNYFKSLLHVPKGIIPFVIGGNPKNGQRWLYNRLISYYQQQYVTDKPLLIDFSSSQFDFSTLLNYWAREMKVPKYQEEEKIRRRKTKIRNALCGRLQTKNQIIIFKNAHDFIHSDHYHNFYTALNDFNEEIEALEYDNKCILFFIEQTPKLYAHKHHCIYSKTVKTWKARKMKEEAMKFIHLDDNLSILAEDIEKWSETLEQHLFKCFDCFLEEKNSLEQLICDCDNGHPESVITKLCEIMSIKYNHQNTWLKH